MGHHLKSMGTQSSHTGVSCYKYNRFALCCQICYNNPMRISHGTQYEETSDKNGFGYATAQMLASLSRLGYEVNQNDPTADVEIWFDQPEWWKFSPGVYRIGYFPWESTALIRNRKPDWRAQLDSCDEVWTPSPIIAEWFRTVIGLKAPVYVYEHGVDPIWTPRKRAVDGTFKFLHCGGEAQRKGVTEAMKATRLAFPNNEDVELNLKIISKGWNIGRLRRVNILNSVMGIEELIQLYHDNHVYVYPSYGEGFGLTPLQALATGMPAITVPAWAPYAEFLDPKLSISSRFVKSPWPALHPGNMLQPSLDDTIDAMRYAYNNYDEVHARALAGVDELMARYDWDRLTKEAFENLENRLKTS